ncbi:MAG: hypothetical protein JOZ16_09965 [Methylobacteriaceae bacterium]|nr:hypothetical protein [Methylobacteriaceae bacterium]
MSFEKQWFAIRGGSRVEYGFGTQEEAISYCDRLNSRGPVGQRSYPHRFDDDVTFEERERAEREGFVIAERLTSGRV